MWVEQGSRWLGRKAGELVVYFVWCYYQQGQRENWRITHYDVECEETGEVKEVPYDTMQKQIAAKRLISIGQYSKDDWVEMSKN